VIAKLEPLNWDRAKFMEEVQLSEYDEANLIHTIGIAQNAHLNPAYFIKRDSLARLPGQLLGELKTKNNNTISDVTFENIVVGRKAIP
jgi:hypothetical protein